MAVKSGLGASLGFAKETTYGTYATVTRFVPFRSETITLEQDYVESGGLQAAVLAQNEGLVEQTTARLSGGIEFDWMTKGMGLILDQLHGNTITLTGSGDAKTQVHNIGATAPDGKSLSLQVGAPDVAGTVQPKTGTGNVVTAIEWEIEQGGILTCSLDIAGQNVVFTQGLATPVYPSGFGVFGFKNASLLLDGADPGTIVTAVRIRLELPRKTDRFGLNGTGLAAEPITNEKIKVSGSFTAEFKGLGQVNAFKDATTRSLTLECEGRGEIETGVPPSTKFEIAAMKTKGGIPTVSGPDVISQDIAFDAYVSGANPLLAITYVSSDTAI